MTKYDLDNFCQGALWVLYFSYLRMLATSPFVALHTSKSTITPGRMCVMLPVFLMLQTPPFLVIWVYIDSPI